MINEDVSFLVSPERLASKAQVRDRIGFVGVLKTGKAKSQAGAGLMIGLAIRPSQRLWQSDQAGGFSGLLSAAYQPGFGKVSAHHISLLLPFLPSDQASKLEEVQAFIHSSFGVAYSLSGISKLFTRLKSSLKLAGPVTWAKMRPHKKLLKKLCPLNSRLC